MGMSPLSLTRRTLRRPAPSVFSKTARSHGARVHEREARRDGRGGSAAPTPPVPSRRLADQIAKCRAERTEALEADLEADLGNGQLCPAQQLLRALDPPPYEVLVGRLAEGSLEAASEMGRR